MTNGNFMTPSKATYEGVTFKTCAELLATDSILTTLPKQFQMKNYENYALLTDNPIDLSFENFTFY